MHAPGEASWCSRGCGMELTEAQPAERCGSALQREYEGQNQHKQNTSKKCHAKYK